MHTYKIRAYRSRSEADTGRVMPQYVCSTGDYVNATLTAKDFADEYGAAVVENTTTGNRIWHVKPPKQSGD